MQTLIDISRKLNIKTLVNGDYLSIIAEGYDSLLDLSTKDVQTLADIVNVSKFGKKTLKFNEDIRKLPYAYLAKYFIINNGASSKGTLRDNITNGSVQLSPKDIKEFYDIYSTKTDKRIKEFCKNIKCIHATKVINLDELFNQKIIVDHINNPYSLSVHSDKPIASNQIFNINICKFLSVDIKVSDFRETLFDTDAVIDINYNTTRMNDCAESLQAFNLRADSDVNRIIVTFDIGSINSF